MWAKHRRCWAGVTLALIFNDLMTPLVSIIRKRCLAFGPSLRASRTIQDAESATEIPRMSLKHSYPPEVAFPIAQKPGRHRPNSDRASVLLP